MMKVVYNACYGGFGLSEAAMRRYFEIKGQPLYVEPGRLSPNYYRTPPETRHPDDYISSLDFCRHDPVLVQVVEELGNAADGFCASLAIAEITADRYRIEEYDGNEEVQEPDDIGWTIIEQSKEGGA